MAHLAMKMFALPRDIQSVTPREGGDHRQTGRMRVDDVRCSLGRLLDLSMGGCLVRRTGAPKPDEIGAMRTLWIDAPTGDRIYLRGELVRHKRVGFRKHELGYRFSDLTEDHRAALCEVARCAVRFEMGFGRRAA